MAQSAVVASRNGLTVVKVFSIAESASGAKQRKVFAEMMEFMEKRGVKDLLCEKVDRLTLTPDSLVSIHAVLKDRFHERQSEIVQETTVIEDSVSDLELQKKQAIEAFKAATSDFMRETFEKEAVEFDTRIKAATTLGAKIGIVEKDIDEFIGYTKSFIEHPAKLLLNTANTRQQVSLYSLVFDTLPSVPELDSALSFN